MLNREMAGDQLKEEVLSRVVFNLYSAACTAALSTFALCVDYFRLSFVYLAWMGVRANAQPRDGRRSTKGGGTVTSRLEPLLGRMHRRPEHLCAMRRLFSFEFRLFGLDRLRSNP